MTTSPAVTWPVVLAGLLERQDLDPQTARSAIKDILDGRASSAQIAGFLIALRSKGETSAELAAMLSEVRAAGVAVDLPPALAAQAIDIVGTGGDGSSSVNLSTMACLVVAGAGVPVCKHGNRAASSACGAADVLEELGVVLEIPPDGVARSVVEAGMGFCFAPRFHPAFRHAGPTRRELGVPTAFNLMGPLANPARVGRLVVGAPSPKLASLLAQVLALSGIERAWVVHGAGGLDELSTGGSNVVFDVRGETVTEFQLTGAQWDLQPASVDDLRGGDAAHNARVVHDLLAGSKGPIRDAVILNAAAGLVVAGAVDALEAGVARARQAIDGGGAAEVLSTMVAVTRDVASRHPV